MNNENEYYLECKDYTVSGELFKLYKDEKYDMLVTVPKPSEDVLGRYYESDDYISHTDSKRTFFEKLYHIVKSYSLRKKVRLITELNNQPGTLLDIGAGTGDFLMQAQKQKWDVIGVEPNDQAKEQAKKKGVLLETTTSNLSSNNFDVITMWHVLEHVPDLSAQIKELKRLLKPNGHLIIAVPNFKSYDAEYYNSHWAAYDVPRHLWHFSEKAIENLFQEEKIKLQKTLPLLFDSFYVSLLSEKYRNGKMNFIKAFRLGFISNLKARRSKQYSSHIYVLKND
ncbi:class I SAM-dependent methyltransferase [uncultured Aquimarina sp.]|uniref:class I SAM-dependent methyltransferase n=1 Tax=uncultured Aquimarina sp. TaxID=575652 RepID=UPI00260E9C75|nr:class I SAM-dependent methyltransferase [uncultured Aquimarina sp.]